MQGDHALVSKAARFRERALEQSNRGNGSRAFRLFLEAAKLGDEEAQVVIGYDYAYGITGGVDVEAALRWWKRAFKKGSWAAAFNLGMFFRDAKQWAKALKWFERAVEAGDPDGLTEIAKIHFRYGGDRVNGLRFLKLATAAKADLTEMARLDLERLSKEQTALSPGDLLYMEASRLDEEGRYAKALPFLLKGAKAGDSSCLIMLGNYLSDGRKGVSIDKDRAVSLYKQVYEQGNSTGASNLAMTYRKLGEVDEAYRWYQLAVEAGDVSSHLALAKIWLHDRSNKKEAIKHLKAMLQGNPYDASEADRDEARVMLRRIWKTSKRPKRQSVKS